MAGACGWYLHDVSLEAEERDTVHGTHAQAVEEAAGGEQRAAEYLEQIFC